MPNQSPKYHELIEYHLFHQNIPVELRVIVLKYLFATLDDNASIRTAVKLWSENKDKAITRYGPIEIWDTSKITDMENLFGDDEIFNENISQWDVSNVTNMAWMFSGTTNFNQPIE